MLLHLLKTVKTEKREESADEIPDFEPQDGTREEPDELNGDLNLIQRIC